MNDSNTILYVEDDENDVFLMERAFKKLQIANPLQVVRDGRQAIAYLKGDSPYQGRPDIELIILDLSMPGKNGLEILRWLREESPLPSLTSIVLTSSNQETDIQRSAALGANGYIIKPGDPAKLLTIVKTVQGYWLMPQHPEMSFAEYAKAFKVAVMLPIDHDQQRR